MRPAPDRTCPGFHRLPSNLRSEPPGGLSTPPCKAHFCDPRGFVQVLIAPGAAAGEAGGGSRGLNVRLLIALDSGPDAVLRPSVRVLIDRHPPEGSEMSRS